MTVPSLALAQPAERYWHDVGRGGIFHMFFGFMMMLLFLAALVVLVVLAVRWLGGSGHHLLGGSPGQGKARALDILKERLARGEIDVAEFEERKRALASVERPPQGRWPLAVFLFSTAAGLDAGRHRTIPVMS